MEHDTTDCRHSNISLDKVLVGGDPRGTCQSQGPPRNPFASIAHRVIVIGGTGLPPSRPRAGGREVGSGRGGVEVPCMRRRG